MRELMNVASYLNFFNVFISFIGWIVLIVLSFKLFGFISKARKAIDLFLSEHTTRQTIEVEQPTQQPVEYVQDEEPYEEEANQSEDNTNPN